MQNVMINVDKLCVIVILSNFSEKINKPRKVGTLPRCLQRIFFSKRFVSSVLDLTEILACSQLHNATETTGLVIGFAKKVALLLPSPPDTGLS